MRLNMTTRALPYSYCVAGGDSESFREVFAPSNIRRAVATWVPDTEIRVPDTRDQIYVYGGVPPAAVAVTFLAGARTGAATVSPAGVVEPKVRRVVRVTVTFDVLT